MMQQQAKIRVYSFKARCLHALIALLVISLLIVGFSFDSLSPSVSDMAYMLHKSCGILVLFLMCIRILVIFKDGRPPLPPEVSLWERILSKTVQYSFYLVLILMPLSGWIMSVAAGYIPSFFNLFNLDLPFIPLNKHIAHVFSKYHYNLAWVICSLVCLHVLGALKHYFWNKDKVVQSMWTWK